MSNHYDVLGVKATSTDAEIKSAYRKLAKEYHPDTNKNPGAEAKFKEINEAYENVKDAGRRAQYDGQRTGPRSHGGFSTHHNPNFTHSHMDLDEILRDIRRSREAYGYDARNRDITLSYSITLEDAFKGIEASVKYNLPGKEQQTIKFKIQQGINHGTKLRFQGKGDDAMKNVAAGDLYVQINIMPHPTFMRLGEHLVTSTTIDYLDAILGAEREIPTIEGSKIKMRVPAGILPGQSLRAAGKGMPLGSNRGDMLVEVVFEPTKLTDEQRALVEQARSKSG